MFSISIYNCSAVLYKGTTSIEAHAGSSISIRKWIENVIIKIGQCKVYGWHRLTLLEETERINDE